MKKNSLFYLSCVVVFLLTACTSENGGDASKAITDDELYKMVSSADVKYKNGQVISPNGNSIHGNFKLYYNSKVSKHLDSDGKINGSSVTFEEGAYIVKEALDASNNSKLYVVMYKSSKDPNQRNGWVWSEFDKDGKVIIGAKDRGSACISCHVQGKGLSYDYTRIFEFENVTGTTPAGGTTTTGGATTAGGTTTTKAITETDLFKMISEANIQYKGGQAIAPNTGSGHGSSKFKLYYNKKVATNLGANEKIKGSSAIFEEGSYIIKEIVDTNNLYVMYKSPNDPNQGKGWLWSKFAKANGQVSYKLTDKGGSCTGCHSGGQGKSNDYTRIFEF